MTAMSSSTLPRPGVAEVALQQGLDLVFPHPVPDSLAGLRMGGATDAGRFPHALQFPGLLAQTHGVDAGAHVKEAGAGSPVPLTPQGRAQQGTDATRRLLGLC